MDDLGDRMKRYEAVTRTLLLPRALTIIRVDGRAFHTYLRNAEKPFDFGFVHDMQRVATQLCREVSGTLFAYGQSDEISLIIANPPESEPWFGGVVQKMASVAAAIATAHFLQFRRFEAGVGIPMFDARVFQVPSPVEAANYVIWRQRDATRNSVSMAAQSKYTAEQLRGVPVDQMQELLWSHYKINWNDYPEEVKRGWVLSREMHTMPVEFVDKRTNQLTSTVAERAIWVISTPHLTVDSELFRSLLYEKRE